MRQRLTACGATDAGPRATNEDAFFVDADGGLFIVADGMGGHNAGEVASELAVRTIVDTVREAPSLGPAAALESAFRAANRRVLDVAHARPECAGMGTTATALVVDAESLTCVSVGDSRLYRLRDGQLDQLTRDDSWLSQLEADGARLSDEDMRRHPMRHVLTEVVGVRADLVPAADVHDVRQGDLWLLSSDGLHGVLTLDEIRAGLGRPMQAEEMARSLVRQAIAAGSSDNVTAIIVRLDDHSR